MPKSVDRASALHHASESARDGDAPVISLA